MFRRLNAATRAVLAAVQGELVARLELSLDSLDRFISDVRGDLDLSLSQVFGERGEPGAETRARARP